MSGEWVLERIGAIQEEIVINKQFYQCGRKKDSDLVCLSLLVSREHCTFINSPMGLYVMDLGSSNGVFINGNRVRPKRHEELRENDLIGIGSAEMSNLDETMFVYKIKNRVILDDSDTPSLDNESERIRRDHNSESKNIRQDRENESTSVRQGLKEHSKLRIVNDIIIPAKLPKKVTEDQSVLNRITDNNDDDDIKIIECTSTSICTTSTSDCTKLELIKSNLNSDVAECSKSSSISKSKIEMTEVKKVPQVVIPSDMIDITVHNNRNEIVELDLEPPINNVKKEPVLMHEADKVVINSKSSFADVNIKVEPENNSAKNNDPIINIKQEPDWGNFSQIDIVEINDDDDSIFPFSQLFDKTNIKQECEDDSGNDVQASLFFDDDENVITIMDSDDENNYQVPESINTVKLKIEPGLENVDLRTDMSSISNASDNIDIDSIPNEGRDSRISIEHNTSIVDKPQNLLEKRPQISLEENVLAKPSTSKAQKSIEEQSLHLSNKESLVESCLSRDSSISSKTKRKQLEIIEPHHVKPKRRTERTAKTEKTEKKTKKKSKNREESEKSDSNKRKKDSSESSKSSRKKDKSKETSSKKHKKDKESHRSPNSTKKHSHIKESGSADKTSDDNIRKDSSSVSCNTSQNSIDENDREKNDKNQSLNKNDSNSVQNTSSASDDPKKTLLKRKTTIVKAKVSAKTRGDMLCDSMQILRPKPKSNAKKTSSEKPNTSTLQANIFSSFVIPRRQIPSSGITNNSISITSQLNSPPSRLQVNNTTPTVLTNATNNINILSPLFNNDAGSSLSRTDPETNDYDELANQAPLKPSLVIPSLLNANRKKVSFKENITTVREFQIQDGNHMRNIKDGLGIRSTRKDLAVYRPYELKIEDFLARVFAWEPIWLEQQQKVKELPPIVKHKDLQELTNSFECFEEYYKKMEVLLLLETWQLLSKEYEGSGNRYTSSVALPCSIVRHSIQQMQTPNCLRYSMMHINTLVSRDQLKLQNHPVFGDMIILEYVIKQGDLQKMRRAFAYITHVQQQNSLKVLHSNELLCRYVKNADAVLTYIVQTRIIDEHTLQFDQISRLRSILYIRPHLRLVQGLQFLPHSELCDSVLKVNIDEFQLKPVTQKQIYEYQLVTQEKLNDRQMEAVIKFTNASINLEPKIGLLVGPPGTGKSKVIANLVTQILYGDGRYVNNKHNRILVCAPSNAAIDEIVLRLLEIRAAIKDHRFRMVRIGRIESMHEEVKKISVTELAKREAQNKFIEANNSNETTEMMKRNLKKDIDALEVLMAGNPQDKYLYDRQLYEKRNALRKLMHKSLEREAAEMFRLESNAKSVIIHKADVIACTLSSCYTNQMESIFGRSANKIATCIVDEATQCCEPETLIPLLLGVKSLILVGDPNQLPATVMSTEAKKLGLDRSLFTRTKEALDPQCDLTKASTKNPVIMLNVQYRMVSSISHWPNKYFYGGKLTDSVNYKQAFPFQPYRILSLNSMQDDIKFSNTSEAVFVGNVINCMMTCAKLTSWDKKITIGVITPYQNQKSVILSKIKEQTRNVPESVKNKFATEVNTIDSFQGQERDVIIMSCVRSSGIGFLSDQQRLCVALTRAKFTLIICGNFNTFQKDNTWKDLLHNARSRGVVARLNTNAKPIDIKPHIVKLE